MRRPPIVPLVLVAVPLVLAVAGPWLAPEASGRGPAFTTDGLLGTDFAGRDVWREVLLGGRNLILVALTATAGAYLLGVPWGLAAATARRAADELLMRPLDMLLAVPSLLLLTLLATIGSGTVLVGALVLVHLPDIARVTRAAALDAANGTAIEAMRLQGETRWRTGVLFVGRSALRTLVTDVGTRLTGTLYLVAAAAFLGIGVSPDTADWAVMIDRNRDGLFLNPWSVLAPALLIVMLTVGLNLAFDRALGTRRYGRRPRRSAHLVPERVT
ncbi:ABC transporter permease subunit [Actinomadura viridis]|uniref:Peptide/nickel transport system permease protein n=1 Tax=Actinomadura viridis TaxID=58110 RepID=A0A931DBW0_9ACTN|nr:ABC transporter permease subunit [Actinomadura viridis]MBG6086034.1 peptide/nickel transport system permease protein [Actinomadura viridis]